MCGILFYKGNEESEEILAQRLKLINHRGPDNSKYISYNNYFFGFNRLCINGLNNESNQPFEMDDIILICNGEIYNFMELKNKYNFEYRTSSDCEIIIHLYKKFGIVKTAELLDGVFAFVLYDIKNNELYSGRDMLGIRSLFISIDGSNVYLSSEMKAICGFGTVEQFPPGTIYDIKNNQFLEWYKHDYEIVEMPRKDIEEKINSLLTAAVEKRLLSERPVACLLSGGLDSTLVTALAAKHYDDYKLNTYSIGMKGSVDLKYAKIAAEYLKTNHTSIELTEKEFLDAIKNTIYMIESYDTTTVRASVGNYLISKYIKENSKDTVIFCGDVSDELFGSYRGFMKAKNKEDFKKENEKMLKNIHYFDVLRSDKTISSVGLEARVPFADKAFVNFIMSLDPKYKMFGGEIIEKKIIRDAFKGVLPDELLYRKI